MNPSILTITKYQLIVGQSGLFNLDVETGLRDGKSLN